MCVLDTRALGVLIKAAGSRSRSGTDERIHGYTHLVVVAAASVGRKLAGVVLVRMRHCSEASGTGCVDREGSVDQRGPERDPQVVRAGRIDVEEIVLSWSFTGTKGPVLPGQGYLANCSHRSLRHEPGEYIDVGL